MEHILSVWGKTKRRDEMHSIKILKIKKTSQINTNKNINKYINF